MGIKGKNENTKIIVGGFNTPCTSMNRSFRQKINKATIALSDKLKIFGFNRYLQKLHSKTEYTFFLSTCGTFSTIYHMLATKQVPTNLREKKLYEAFF